MLRVELAPNGALNVTSSHLKNPEQFKALYAIRRITRNRWHENILAF